MLDPKIVGDDMPQRRRRSTIAAQAPWPASPIVGRLNADHPGKVHPGETGEGCRFGKRALVIDLDGHDAARLRALFPQQACQLARVDPGNRNHAVFLQIRGQCLLQTPIRCPNRQVTNHQPCGMVARRFEVLGITANVADMRIGQGDDLATVRGIGQYFLIASHRRVEHDFTAGTASGADRQTAENRAVSQCENRGRKSG
ncbi:MAG: hypothetical protein CAPSK01_001306 [Candidatus Accumulibacter vicinus]|uniref:Uncharacterized protein n=1 Tax=Candidatus Accumulibacter vicinus TaxID=2954382 RepID=A0A084Y321_9PROT|nr:MAG: hypothetical protein CAPSK01_001306 [Candidatus Accumulibacter vicinus]